MRALQEGSLQKGLGPDISLHKSPVTYFGIIESQKHRERGIDLAMFLGLFKYYRQCYIDLIIDAGFELDYENWCHLFIRHFFDLIEISICKDWTTTGSSDEVYELQQNNLIMTNEKNKYLTIFESSPNPIIFLDNKGKIENMNFAASNLLFGASTPGSGYYGEKKGVYIPSWLQNELDAFCIIKADEYNLEKNIDGFGYYDIKFKRMLDVSEKFIGAVVIFNDITKEKLVEEALEESRDFFLKLLDDFPALIWKSGMDGRCDYFNSKWLEFTGQSLNHEMNNGWLEGVFKGDREYCFDTYMEAFDKRQPFEIEYRLRRYDGQYRWIRDFGRPYKNTDGNFAGYIGSCYDVTDHKKAEIILSRYRLLSGNTRDVAERK